MTYRAWNTKEVDRAALKELTAAIAQQNTEELENQSMDDGPWSEEKYRSVFAAQQKEAGLLAGILAARGITDPAEALTLLAGEEELSDPMLLTDMDKACARILRAIDEGETIVVFGDYDVDGVTATALLYQHLKGMGASAKCMLPSREGDGYGLSKNAIQSIYDKGCRLIVTVDNGISAVEEAAFAASLGIDLIITDHHLPHESLPQAVAIVDPRRTDDHSPFKGLCGAGVAFKLCAALDGCPPEEMLEYCGDLAAVGTVADVMPLTGENRTIVKAGLRQLQNTDRPGFCALLEEVGLAGRPVTAENVSYAIAPRINAAGRMDSAVTALQLVLCEDEDRAEELAHKLTDINSQRQETEMEIVRAAQELLDAEPERLEDRVILLWGRDWHPGVIGIVASRLVEKTGRPVIVVSVDEHGEGKGSGRSVQGLATCTSASPPAPTSCSASAATPWRRASRCGRKTCPPSVGGSTTGRHGSAPCCAHRRWNVTCPSTSTALRWKASAASTSWPPTVPTTPARSSCWKRLSWKGCMRSRRASTPACGCGRGTPVSMRSGSGCIPSRCPMPPATSWMRQ